MSNTVESTLLSALPAGAINMYPAEYHAVLDALTERDRALAGQIADVVVWEFKVDRDEVLTRLEQAGMAVRQPRSAEPVHTISDEPAVFDGFEAPEEEKPAKAKKGKKDKTAKLVRKLVKAARRHGVSI